MHSLWLEGAETYDGQQLQPLHNYLKHGLLGNSIVSWVGSCDVDFSHMLDGEDLRAQSPIRGEKMLHFVLEVFDQSLHAGVLLQRLMGEMMAQNIRNLGDLKKAQELIRKGDDLYWQQGKLNVSIATCSSRSFLIHFGINVTNEGTPVKTAALSDFAIKDAVGFAKAYMQLIVGELESQIRATQKVITF